MGRPTQGSRCRPPGPGPRFDARTRPTAVRLTRKGRSEPYTATPSGVVSAGSDPAGHVPGKGVGQVFGSFSPGAGDELLTPVDVVGRTGHSGVGHEVHGERGDVG